MTPHAPLPEMTRDEVLHRLAAVERLLAQYDCGVNSPGALLIQRKLKCLNRIKGELEARLK